MVRISIELGRRKYRKIPVIGIRQVGKTYFFFTLAHVVSELQWGEVDDQKYFMEMWEYIGQGLPIPPSVGRKPIKLNIKGFEVEDNYIPCRFSIYTEDFGGAEFEELMRLLARGDADQIDQIRPEQKDLLNAFSRLFRNADALIVIIDIVRKTDDKGKLLPVTADEFQKNRDKFILSSFAEQVVPLTNAIDMFVKMNPKVRGKPIFLVASKFDIHRMSKAEIEKYFSRLMTMNIQRLRNRGFVIKWYNTTSYGFGGSSVNEILTQYGYLELLHDLADYLGKKR